MRTALFILLIGALSISTSHAQCAGRCFTRHPQRHYCDSDFAMRVTIVDEDIHHSDIPKTKLYTAEILNSWKRGPGEGELQFYVPASFCGSTLNVSETYVVTGTREVTEDGRRYWLHGSCDYMNAWDAMSAHQKTGFKKEFKSQCEECTVPLIYVTSNVKVEDMDDNDYSEASTYWTPTNCYYNPQKTKQFIARRGSEVEDCEELYGLCERNRAGECQWKMTAQYKACFKYRDDFVLVDSGKFAVTDESQCEVYTNRRKRRNCRKRARQYQEENGSSVLYLGEA